MTVIRTSLFISMLVVNIFHQSNGYNVTDYWVSADLTPDPIQTPPEDLAEVTFANDVTVATGQPLNVSQIANQPVTISYAWNSSELYAFIILDVDAPSRANPVDSQLLLWLSVNNPGQSGAGYNTDSGQDIAPYMPPNPANGTGAHRCVVLSFLQSNRIDVEPLNERIKFNYLNYTTQNNMGNPISGNIFIVNANNATDTN